MSQITENIIQFVAFGAAFCGGIYLCLHDFPTLGGLSVILSLGCYFILQMERVKK